jgi:pullulanase/glycogen debranching enzyme
MTKTDDIAVFNDEARDLVKAGGMNERGQGFLTGRQVNLKHLFYNLTGRPQINYHADSPLDSVLYFDCHDGLTLHDSIVVNANINESQPKEREKALDLLKIANAMLLTSQGIVFLHAGQEFGRTKPAFGGSFSNDGEIINQFVKNSYDSSDNINQIHWLATNETELSYRPLIEYTKGLLALRKKFKAFTLGSQKEVEKATNFIETSNPFVLCYTIESEGKLWYLCFNASEYSHSICFGKSGKLEVYGNKDIVSPEAFGEILINEKTNYEVQPRSTFIGCVQI